MYNEGIKRMIDKQLEESKKEKQQKRKEISELFDSKVRLHLVLGGVVQGVGFRAFTKREADKLGITGWVKNTPDETVEIVAEGQKDLLKILLDLCRKGPHGAHVDKAEENWEEYKDEFSSFDVH